MVGGENLIRASQPETPQFSTKRHAIARTASETVLLASSPMIWRSGLRPLWLAAAQAACQLWTFGVSKPDTRRLYQMATHADRWCRQAIRDADAVPDQRLIDQSKNPEHGLFRRNPDVQMKRAGWHGHSCYHERAIWNFARSN